MLTYPMVAVIFFNVFLYLLMLSKLNKLKEDTDELYRSYEQYSVGRYRRLDADLFNKFNSLNIKLFAKYKVGDIIKYKQIGCGVKIGTIDKIEFSRYTNNNPYFVYTVGNNIFHQEHIIKKCKCS